MGSSIKADRVPMGKGAPHMGSAKSQTVLATTLAVVLTLACSCAGKQCDGMGSRKLSSPRSFLRSHQQSVCMCGPKTIP